MRWVWGNCKLQGSRMREALTWFRYQAQTGSILLLPVRFHPNYPNITTQGFALSVLVFPIWKRVRVISVTLFCCSPDIPVGYSHNCCGLTGKNGKISPCYTSFGFFPFDSSQLEGRSGRRAAVLVWLGARKCRATGELRARRHKGQRLFSPSPQDGRIHRLICVSAAMLSGLQGNRGGIFWIRRVVSASLP